MTQKQLRDVLSMNIGKPSFCPTSVDGVGGVAGSQMKSTIPSNRTTPSNANVHVMAPNQISQPQLPFNKFLQVFFLFL